MTPLRRIFESLGLARPASGARINVQRNALGLVVQRTVLGDPGDRVERIEERYRLGRVSECTSFFRDGTAIRVTYRSGGYPLEQVTTDASGGVIERVTYEYRGGEAIVRQYDAEGREAAVDTVPSYTVR